MRIAHQQTAPFDSKCQRIQAFSSSGLIARVADAAAGGPPLFRRRQRQAIDHTLTWNPPKRRCRLEPPGATGKSPIGCVNLFQLTTLTRVPPPAQAIRCQRARLFRMGQSRPPVPGTIPDTDGSKNNSHGPKNGWVIAKADPKLSLNPPCSLFDLVAYPVARYHPATRLPSGSGVRVEWVCAWSAGRSW